MSAKKILVVFGVGVATAIVVLVPGGSFPFLVRLFSKEFTEEERRRRALLEASKCIKQE